MSDVSYPPVVSGIPEDSRAARRLRPRPDGGSRRLAPRLRRLPSLVVSWIVADIGAAVLAGAMICIGLFMTHVVLASDAIAGADDRFPEWLAEHRTSFWTEWSHIASLTGDRPILIPLVGVISLVLVLRHRWRMASFVIQVGLVEALAYLITVAVVHRERPTVTRLDELNPVHSFPSGHTAAATAIYTAIALLLTAHFRGRAARIAIWVVAVVLPLDVALSRIYRGEHHPLDVVAGALLGLTAVLVALFAARTARAVAELRVEVSR
jgi:undecaprenyl-diphosphatase